MIKNNIKKNRRYWTNKVEKIEKYFPATDNATILEFMSDDRFEEKTNAFTAYIAGICDQNETNVKTFSDSLMDLLFHRDYIKSHKWVFSK